jgi:hypothetical protein
MIISAAITPGIHPKRVKSNTIRIDPQPRSYTANGGKTIDNNTRQTLIYTSVLVEILHKDINNILAE